jgi:hypothetical protein
MNTEVYMSTTDESIEQEIQAKGKTAPRVTPADIEAEIASEFYFAAADGVRGELLSSLPELGVNFGGDNPLSLLTFCVLVLRNGFTVTGESACASPENFDAEIGRKIARQNAVQKIWPLLGLRAAQQAGRQLNPGITPELPRNYPDKPPAEVAFRVWSIHPPCPVSSQRQQPAHSILKPPAVKRRANPQRREA